MVASERVAKFIEFPWKLSQYIIFIRLNSIFIVFKRIGMIKYLEKR